MKKQFLIPLLYILNLLLGNADREAYAQCNVWTQKADFGGMARRSAVGFSIGNKGYLGVGSEIGNYPQDFWEFDPDSNIWTQKVNFGGIGRWGTVGFSIGSKGYIGTGSDGADKQDFWEYDPVSNTWNQMADFGGTARYGAVGFSIGNKGYIGTGNDGADKQDFWEYDPITNTWIQKADFGGMARRHAVGFSIGSKGYIGIGCCSFVDFWEYDPGTNIWIQKTDFGGIASEFAVGFSINNKGYIGTGRDGAWNNKQDLWEYDPNTNTWIQKSNFSGTARHAAVGFSIGSKGYIGTGEDGTRKQDFWEYNPLADVTTNICLITVDTTSTKNIIVWEKPVTLGIDSFRIYREFGLNNYVHIASVAYSELSEFTDTTSGINPIVQSYRYKISALDTCGNENALSSHHRTIHLATPQYTPPSTFDLIWTNDYEGFFISGYNILRDGYNTNTWDSIGFVTFGNLSYTDINSPSDSARYIIEAAHPTGCTATLTTAKAKNYNKTRSNYQNRLGSTGINELQVSDHGLKVYPNPYTGRTQITYSLTEKANVSLEVLNVLGGKVKAIVKERQNLGKYQYSFSAKDLGYGEGMYILKLTINQNFYTKKLMEF